MGEHSRDTGTGPATVIAIVAGLLCCALPLVLVGGAGGLFTVLGSAGVPFVIAAAVVVGFVAVVLVLRRRVPRHPRSPSIGSQAASADECCAPEREPDPVTRPLDHSISGGLTGRRSGGR